MSYLSPLEKLYIANGSMENAVPMAKYMQNKFEFCGIKTPDRRELDKKFLKEHGMPKVNELPGLIKTAYSKPQREFQYFIVDLTAKFQKQLPEKFLRTAKFMVATKSWWDTVDPVAATIVGGLVRTYPSLVLTMDEWIADDNLWLQRTAILHQLKYRDKTDQKRLFDYCRRNKDSKEFFIRKAIGWALREYSKTNPKAVIKFVRETSLSPLSKREAMKVMERKKK